jgi:hypothetical protein
VLRLVTDPQSYYPAMLTKRIYTELSKALCPKSKSAYSELCTIMDFAMHLKNDMTRELVIYRCRLFNGSEVPNTMFDSIDGNPRGVLRLCVFPGFIRQLKSEDGNIVKFCVTKAKIEQI